MATVASVSVLVITVPACTAGMGMEDMDSTGTDLAGMVTLIIIPLCTPIPLPWLFQLHRLSIFSKKTRQYHLRPITGITARNRMAIIHMSKIAPGGGCLLRPNRPGNDAKRLSMYSSRTTLLLVITTLLGACVHMPTGPSVMTLPGAGKSFEQFRADDYECRGYAYQQIGGVSSRQASQTSGIESAAIGTGLGAAAGAAIAGGSGAAIGAGTGLLAGSVVGSGTASSSGYVNQQRYDISYIQCMYAKGHRVPVSGKITSDQPANRPVSPRISNPPANFTPPPPPPGNPPPPPLR